MPRAGQRGSRDDRDSRSSLERSHGPQRLGLGPARNTEGRRVRTAHLAWSSSNAGREPIQQQGTATRPDSNKHELPPTPALAGIADKRPAAPLVRDEEAVVPAACPIGEVPAGSHGRSRSDHRYPRRLRNRQVAGERRHRVPKLIVQPLCPILRRMGHTWDAAQP